MNPAVRNIMIAAVVLVSLLAFWVWIVANSTWTEGH
jgi:hypothetical protein